MDATTSPRLRKLMGLITERGIRRQDLAAQLGYSESMFSLYLHGRRPAPDGFEGRVLAALDLLQRAHSEAQAAYDRVLAEGPTEVAHE